LGGSTAHLVAPDPATSPFWGAAPVRLTLTVRSQQTTDLRRLGAEQRIQPIALSRAGRLDADMLLDDVLSRS
jgi:hypothetical protein